MTRMITTEHFRSITAFVQAADAGSFTLAATQLGLSKSGVAKSVSRLEERFGVRLFSRTTRSFSLTAEGQAFYESCVRALAELEGAEEALLSNRLVPTGRLRVDLPVVLGRRWVLPVLLGIAERYPKLEMEVSLTDRFVDPAEEGVDLLVRIGELQDSAVLVGRHLGTQTSVVCASPTYLASRGVPMTVDDLDHHACLAFGRGGRTVPWTFLDGNGKAVPKPVRGRLTFNVHDAIRDAALAGHGLALLSTWLIADDLAAGRLVQVLPEARTLGFPIHALWPQSRHLSAKVRVVVDELVSHFLPSPPWKVL